MPSARIIGAGIAGLTAGIGLARAGWQVRIDERTAGLSEVGAGIQLGPNATRILLGLGLEGSLEAIGRRPERLVVRRFKDGAVLAEAAFGPLTARFGAPYVTLKRADLQAVLLKAALDAGVEVVLDAAVEAAPPMPDDGLLIGADGLHSVLRGTIDPSARPAFTGYEAWRTLAPMAHIDNCVTLWLGAGKHCVTYPVGQGSNPALNLVFIRHHPVARQGWSNEGARREALRYFDGAAPALADSAASAPEWKLWSLFDMPPSEMSDGRSILIGDAAHPVLPFLAQGAGLAIEDAGGLSALARSGETIPPGVLHAFSEARRARAARVRDAARANGRIYHLTGPLAFARDAAMRMTGGSGLLNRYDWLYGFDSEAAAKALIGKMNAGDAHAVNPAA